MERDAALLAQVEARGGSRARLYRWSGPWVSLGRFQRPERDLLPGSPAPWVRRPTGGRAVLHGHDVTVALALAFDAWREPPRRRSPKALAEDLTRPLALALAACGAEAVPGPGDGSRPGRSADCFAHVAPTDLADASSGAKLCGAALRLTDRAVLLQASLPVGPPLVDPAAVFALPSPWHGRTLAPDRLEAALVSALEAWAAYGLAT